MNKTAITVTAMLCTTAGVVGHWHATAGPLDPPPEAFDSPGTPGETSPSLSQIEAQIQDFAGAAGTQNGLACDGFAIGALCPLI